MLIDTKMVSVVSTEALAALNSGRALTWVAIMVGIGLMSGVPVLVAHAVGAQKPALCGAIWRQGMCYAAVIGTAMAVVISLAAKPLFSAFHQPAALIPQSYGYALFIGWTLPFALMLRVCDGFLQGIGRAYIGTLVGFSALPFNIAFNWVFIYGTAFTPAMGATGAALGTLLADVSALILMLFVLRRTPAHYHLRGTWRTAWRHGQNLRRFGYGPGLASGLELGGFSILTLFAGALGPSVGGAFGVVTVLHTLALCAAVGFGGAASVRIGEAMGAGATGHVPSRGWLAMGAAATITGLFGLFYAYMPMWTVDRFDLDLEASATAVTMLTTLAPFMLFDSAQFVLVYALRAAGDGVGASLIQILGFFVLMSGAGVWCIHVLHLGAPGLILSLNIGIIATALLLALRFWFMCHRGLEHRAEK